MLAYSTINGPADATTIDIFVKPPVRPGGLPTFDVELKDRFGNIILSPGTALLSVPGPAPATGYVGLIGLALGLAGLRLRERVAAR